MKDVPERMRREVTNREKIFAKDISDQTPLLKMHNKTLKCNNKKIKNSTKTGPKIWTPGRRYIDDQKSMERCTKLYVTELQIKTHLTVWPKSTTWTTPDAGEDVGQQGLSFTGGENDTITGRQFVNFL